jgi:hypothetical protein
MNAALPSSSPSTPRFEQGEMFKDYSLEIADKELAIEFLEIVDSRIKSTEILLGLSAGGLDGPGAYDEDRGQRRYMDNCEAEGVIPYSALTIDATSDVVPRFEVNSLGVDRQGYFPGRNISVGRAIASKGGFQKITYLPPRNGTIGYGGNLRELVEGGYAITDAELTFRADRKDLSPASYAGSLSMTKDRGVYCFSINIGERMDEQRARDLRTLIEAAELAKLDSSVGLDEHLYEQYEAEIEAIGARPIANAKESNYFGQIVLATMIYSKPDIGLEVREDQYEFGSPRRIPGTGYSVWAELGKHAQSCRIYEDLGRNKLIFTLGSASHMAYVGPDIIFDNFDEHLGEAGVVDPKERARYKATIARWAIMQIDQTFEEADWNENGYAVPTQRMSEAQATKQAYQKALAAIEAEPFSDQEIAKRVAAVIDEESSKAFRWRI